MEGTGNTVRVHTNSPQAANVEAMKQSSERAALDLKVTRSFSLNRRLPNSMSVSRRNVSYSSAKKENVQNGVEISGEVLS